MRNAIIAAVLAAVGILIWDGLSKADQKNAAVDACVVAKLDALPNQADRADNIGRFTRECMK